LQIKYNKVIRVLIIEDNVVESMSSMSSLSYDTGMKLFRCSADITSISLLCSSIAPDIIILSSKMFDICENENILKGHKIIIILKNIYTKNALLGNLNYNEIGAYLADDIEPEAFRLAVKSVAAGIFVTQKNIISDLASQSIMISEAAVETSFKKDINLTAKERVVINHIITGKSNKEIAATLFLSEGRIKNIVSNILVKLNLDDRTQLAVFAIRNNICNFIS
jgi:DNA-binding NarL/FixJ family response regulator